MSYASVTVQIWNLYVIAYLRKFFIRLSIPETVARKVWMIVSQNVNEGAQWNRAVLLAQELAFNPENQSAACATTHSYAKRQTQRSPLTELFHQHVSEGWLYGVMGEGHAPVKGSTEKASCRALAPCPASAQWPVSPDTTTQLIIHHHINLSPALEMQAPS